MGISISKKKLSTVKIADEVTTRKREAPSINVFVGSQVNVADDKIALDR